MCAQHNQVGFVGGNFSYDGFSQPHAPGFDQAIVDRDARRLGNGPCIGQDLLDVDLQIFDQIVRVSPEIV